MFKDQHEPVSGRSASAAARSKSDAESAEARFPRLSALAAEVQEATAHVAEHMRESKAMEYIKQKESECNRAARSYLLKASASLSLGTYFAFGVMPHNAASWAPLIKVEPIIGAAVVVVGVVFTCIFYEKASLADEYAEMRKELSAASGAGKGTAEGPGRAA